jgi:phosphoribosylformimino-5-aminoimidazole carboxamide ribotide isomerase
MKIYPAIDLKNGACVRLYKGDMAQATMYNSSPGAQAASFAQQGFAHLHVVDLDGAISGDSANKQAVLDIMQSSKLPVQLGGGIRSRAAVEAWLQAGVARVILGTIALRNPELVREVARAFPGQIIVGIDAKSGMVATEGWVEDSNISAVELAKMFEDAGIAGIIYTDIARDGTLEGPNLQETVALAAAVQIPVILSGGIGSIADVRAAIEHPAKNIAGIIVGKALYEQKINPAELLQLAASAAKAA